MYRLMIVDDEVEILNGLALFDWASCGFQICAALPNGKEALDYVLSHPVDVALCDIKMEVMSGLDFANEIRARELPLKIVLLTGYKDMDFISQAMHAGCYDYILKPTKFSRLIAVFSSLKEILDEEWKRNTANMAEYGDERDNDVIQYALTYIRSHLETVSLESLSDYLGLSPVYISRLFKEKTGSSFSDFYQQERFNKATEMLRNPDITIVQIASALGYTNSTNFSRAFKSSCGESPTEYRSHLRLKNE